MSASVSAIRPRESAWGPWQVTQMALNTVAPGEAEYTAPSGAGFALPASGSRLSIQSGRSAPVKSPIFFALASSGSHSGFRFHRVMGSSVSANFRNSLEIRTSLSSWRRAR